MENYEINFDKLTQKEAQKILDMIVDMFTTYASCKDVHGWNEVTCIELGCPEIEYNEYIQTI